MMPEEAGRYGISEEDRRLYIRSTNGKANMDRIGRVSWFKLESEDLPNGDKIACAIPWKPPNPFQGVTTADMRQCRALVQSGAYRLDMRSPDWVGYMIAGVLKIDIAHKVDNDPKDVARIKEIVRTWLKNNVLDTEQREHEHRKKKTFVITGKWSEPPEAYLDERP